MKFFSLLNILDGVLTAKKIAAIVVGSTMAVSSAAAVPKIVHNYEGKQKTVVSDTVNAQNSSIKMQHKDQNQNQGQNQDRAQDQNQNQEQNQEQVQDQNQNQEQSQEQVQDQNQEQQNGESIQKGIQEALSHSQAPSHVSDVAKNKANSSVVNASASMELPKSKNFRSKESRQITQKVSNNNDNNENNNENNNGNNNDDNDNNENSNIQTTP